MVSTSVLVLGLMERLIELRPEFSLVWKRAGEVAVEHIVADNNADKVNSSDESLFYEAIQMKNFSAQYFCAAEKLFPNKNYDKHALECLQECTTRKNFYPVLRGLPIAKLHPLGAGDYYRDIFCAEGHICWLFGYWHLKNGSDPGKTKIFNSIKKRKI